LAALENTNMKPILTAGAERSVGRCERLLLDGGILANAAVNQTRRRYPTASQNNQQQHKRA